MAGPRGRLPGTRPALPGMAACPRPESAAKEEGADQRDGSVPARGGQRAPGGAWGPRTPCRLSRGSPPHSVMASGGGGAQAGRGARPQQPAGVAGFVNTHFLPFPLCCQGLRAPPGLLRTTATPTRLRPRWSRQAVEGQTGTRDPAGAGARPLPPHTRGVPTIKLLSTAQAVTVQGQLPPPRPAAALHQLLPPWGTFRSRDRDPPRSDERQKNRFL